MVIVLLLITFLTTASLNGEAQSRWVFENYKYWGQNEASTIVPTVHFETGNKWCAELRYNYEEAETFSLFAGKTIAGGRKTEYSFSPMVGYSVGLFTGLSFAVNSEAEWKSFYLSSQTQYSIALKNNAENFFFTWSELGYNISPHFFSGLTAQFTMQSGSSDLEPGFVAGVTLKNFTIPFYIFSPFKANRYFAIGINYEYNFKKRNK